MWRLFGKRKKTLHLDIYIHRYLRNIRKNAHEKLETLQGTWSVGTSVIPVVMGAEGVGMGRPS